MGSGGDGNCRLVIGIGVTVIDLPETEERGAGLSNYPSYKYRISIIVQLLLVYVVLCFKGNRGRGEFHRYGCVRDVLIEL